MLGAALSFASFFFVGKWEDDRVRLEFEQLAVERARALRDALREDVSILTFLRSLYVSSERVTREEFAAFVEPPLLGHPEIHSLAWIPRVPASERNAFEERIRAEGFSGFEIRTAGHRAG
ncbi:MAG: CHASE domain-containing protein, partial [Candidatus Binatia bacterium]